jgi:acyl carrier protein
MSLREELKTYIHQNLIRDKDIGAIGDHDSLVEHGILDSLALFNLLTFIEDQTGIRVPDTEVLLENFDTVAAIEQTVDRLRSAGLGRH